MKSIITGTLEGGDSRPWGCRCHGSGQVSRDVQPDRWNFCLHHRARRLMVRRCTEAGPTPCGRLYQASEKGAHWASHGPFRAPMRKEDSPRSPGDPWDAPLVLGRGPIVRPRSRVMEPSALSKGGDLTGTLDAPIDNEARIHTARCPRPCRHRRAPRTSSRCSASCQQRQKGQRSASEDTAPISSMVPSHPAGSRKSRSLMMNRADCMGAGPITPSDR